MQRPVQDIEKQVKKDNFKPNKFEENFMLLTNPFAALSATISPDIMQGYIVLMVLLVIGGTILDMIHKKSAQYFFENAKKAKKSAKRTVSVGEQSTIAVKVLVNEVLTSGEFKNHDGCRGNEYNETIHGQQV